MRGVNMKSRVFVVVAVALVALACVVAVVLGTVGRQEPAHGGFADRFQPSAVDERTRSAGVGSIERLRPVELAGH